MKRNRIRPGLAGVVAAAVLLAMSLPASRAAGLAPEEAERLQRLNGLVEDLLASHATMQKRLSALTDELQAAREGQTRSDARLGDRFATREEVRKLAQDLREIDRKREEDKRLILEEIRKLAQVPVVVPKDPPKPPPAREPAGPPVATKGYTYVVKKDDTISAIVQAYRTSGVNVSVNDVLRANPNVKPTALREGQELFIPDPALK